MRNSNKVLSVLETCLIGTAVLIAAVFVAHAEESSGEQPFADYARYGADVWARNPMALISGDGQACVSCHTSLPYALVEPLLPDDYPAYSTLLNNIDNRIRTWHDNTAWYSDDKLEKTAIAGGMPPDALKEFLNARESRGVEAVFNAFIRAMHDAYSGAAATTETTLAFENLWNEQVRSGPATGRWGWIQANLVPWEVKDSDVWGASLACVAASLFPEQSPRDQRELLYTSLRQASVDSGVSLHSKAAVLWCDAESGGQVLAAGVAAELVSDLLALQQASGGWALRDLGPWADWEGSDADCCAQRDVRSDAYATGFASLALLRNKQHLPTNGRASIDKAITWIDRQLANPYPAGPRYNAHNSSDAELPEFRDNLYANAGAMWSYLAKRVQETQQAPWDQN